MCRDDYLLYERPAPRKVSAAGYPVFQARHVVAWFSSAPGLKDVQKQAVRTRDHLLGTPYHSQSIMQIQSPGGSRLSVYVLSEPEDDFDGDAQILLDDVTLCLSLNAKVLLCFNEGGFEPYEALDPEDVETTAPRIMQILSFNCR